MYRALLWYTQKLQEAHGGLLTPARIVMMSRDLDALQGKMILSEPAAVWKVPVRVHVEPESNHFEVVVSDETNVLYMDPE